MDITAAAACLAGAASQAGNDAQQSRTIQAVIFDFGGVLMRTVDYRGRQRWEKRLGLAPGALSELVFNSPTAHRATRGEIGAEAVWENVATTLALDAGQLRQLQVDFWSGDRLDTELVAYLRGLRPRYKTAVLSNAWRDMRTMLTQELKLNEAVDALIISAEEGVAKPDVRLYHLAAGRLGVPPTAAVLVDDFIENVAGARAAGMAAIHFREREQALAELEQLLDHG